MSIWMPASSSARSTPICAQPRAAPPPRAREMPDFLTGFCSGGNGSTGRSPPFPPSCLLRKDAHSSIAHTPYPARIIANGSYRNDESFSGTERVRLRLVGVDRSWVEPGRIAIAGEACIAICELHRPVEARTSSGVAGCIMTADLHLQPDDILVAVGSDLDDLLDVARRLALLPQAATRSRPEMGNAGFKSQGERFSVHIRDHKQRAITRIGDDRRDQSVTVEARREGRTFLE